MAGELRQRNAKGGPAVEVTTPAARHVPAELPADVAGFTGRAEHLKMLDELIPDATDPTPEDLVQVVEEYQLGVGDVVSIRVLDFLERGVESEFTPTVDELGYINVPQIGWLHVEGMTARELRGEIIQRARQVGVFREEGSEPTVVITFLQQQQRSYQIWGTIQQPSRYRYPNCQR